MELGIYPKKMSSIDLSIESENGEVRSVVKFSIEEKEFSLNFSNEMLCYLASALDAGTPSFSSLQKAMEGNNEVLMLLKNGEILAFSVESQNFLLGVSFTNCEWFDVNSNKLISMMDIIENFEKKSGKRNSSVEIEENAVSEVESISFEESTDTEMTTSADLEGISI